MTIQNNLQTAEQVATKMGNAADSIERAIQRPVLRAKKTTVTVSTKAQQAHDEAAKLVQLFQESFLETIDNIRLVSIEFERTDHELQDSIRKLLPLQDSLRDIRTYNKAKNE